MIKVILVDFSWTLLFPIDEGYKGKINLRHRELAAKGPYEFWDHFKFNQPLLEFLDQIKDRYRLCILTAGTVQDVPVVRKKLNEIFEQIFSAARLKKFKHQPEVYEELGRKLGVKPEEMLFIDDKMANLEAAKRAGLKVIQFKGNDELFLALNEILA